MNSNYDDRDENYTWSNETKQDDDGDDRRKNR